MISGRCGSGSVECEWVRESTCDPERAHNTHHHPPKRHQWRHRHWFFPGRITRTHCPFFPFAAEWDLSFCPAPHAEGARVLPTFFAIWPKLEIFALGRAATRWEYGVRERVSKRQKTLSSLRHFRSLSVQPEAERRINETFSQWSSSSRSQSSASYQNRFSPHSVASGPNMFLCNLFYMQFWPLRST